MGTFDALRHRDYRVLWTGALISHTGTWMEAAVLSWFVFDVTRSPFWVGLVAFANFAPMVLSPIGGVLADRMPPRRILFTTQWLMLGVAATLAILAATGTATRWSVLGLALAEGIGIAFNGPTWMTFIPRLVPEEALVNAVALNSAQWSVARVIGPALGTALLGVFGYGLVFGINALSFVSVLVALSMIRPRARPAAAASPRDARFMREGFRMAWANRRVRAILFAVVALAFFAGPTLSLLPVYVGERFGRGAGELGLLMSVQGAGAVLGALALGRLGSRLQRPPLIAAGMVAVALSMLVLAVSPGMLLALPAVAVFGAGYLFCVSGMNSDVQLAIGNEVRGRVMSIYLMALVGTYAFGSLAAGSVAQHLGAPVTSVGGAVVCGVAGLGLLRWWRTRDREPVGAAIAASPAAE